MASLDGSIGRTIGARERLSAQQQREELAADAEFRPIRLLEVELSGPLPAVPAIDPNTGERSDRGMTLVRLHTQPLGMVPLNLDGGGLSPAEYARKIWFALSETILAHLYQDGLPSVGGLKQDGLPGPVVPPCTRGREQALANAPFVSVVVPTRDRPEFVRTCLASLTTLAYPDYEVLVVDNAPSTAATAVVVAAVAADFPWVRYLREDRPGASWARNRGLSEAKG
ncbi:MAG: glycosyltransferase family 2 protein, partial [Chloroflexota bacterium]